MRPRIDDEAWAAAAPIVKQAAVGAALQTIDDYARASAAAGGFDRPEAQLTPHAPAAGRQGLAAAAKACEKLLAELGRIEEAAAKRIAKDPHAEGTSDAALVLLLFEAIRLSAARRPADARPPAADRRKRAAPARRRRASPSTEG